MGKQKLDARASVQIVVNAGERLCAVYILPVIHHSAGNTFLGTRGANYHRKLAAFRLPYRQPYRGPERADGAIGLAAD